MKKLNITAILGLTGSILWSFTGLLRAAIETNNNAITFILGIMPNIAASWSFLFLAEIISEQRKKEFTFKTASISSALILLFAIISEIIHDLFLNSPFDIYDIIATICSLILYLIIFHATKKGLRKQ